MSLRPLPAPSPVHPPGADEYPASAPALTLRDFLNVLRRRRGVALATFALVLGAITLLTLLTRPRFEANARLLVSTQQNAAPAPADEGALSTVFQATPTYSVETQIELLRSPKVLNQVYARSGVKPDTVELNAGQVRNTDVIEVAVNSPSPEDALKFAKAWPSLYLEQLRQDRLRQVSDSLAFAQKRLGEQRTLLQRAEGDLADFKINRGVVDTAGERTQAVGAAGETRAALATAEAEAAVAGARFNALLAERQRLPGQIETPIQSTNTEELNALNSQLGTLQNQLALAKAEYSDAAPEVVAVQEQIDELRARIARTPRTRTNTTRAPNPAVAIYDDRIAEARTALRAAQANRAQAIARLRQQSGTLQRYVGIERNQAALERAVVTASSNVAALGTSVEQLGLRRRALQAANDPVEVIKPAVDARKVSPQLGRNLALALVLGTLLACAMAALQESLDDRVSSEEGVRRLLGAPILGHFPTSKSGADRALLSLAGSDRHLLERFRVLRSNVQFTMIDPPGRTLLITSAVPGEGKSYTAANLAIAMALEGRRVILVDCDLHRPRLHEMFDIARSPGLTGVLSRETTLEQALRPTKIENLQLLPAGAVPPNPTELLNSPSMQTIAAALIDSSDMVIFDSPPLLATADAQVLSSRVDGVLLVAQMGKLRKSEMKRAMELLEQARARVIGVSLNKISGREDTGFHDYGYNMPVLDAASSTKK